MALPLILTVTVYIGIIKNRRNDSEDDVEVWKDDVEDVLKRVCDEVESIHRSES